MGDSKNRNPANLLRVLNELKCSISKCQADYSTALMLNRQFQQDCARTMSMLQVQLLNMEPCGEPPKESTAASKKCKKSCTRHDQLAAWISTAERENNALRESNVKLQHQSRAQDSRTRDLQRQLVVQEKKRSQDERDLCLIRDLESVHRRKQLELRSLRVEQDALERRRRAEEARPTASEGRLQKGDLEQRPATAGPRMQLTISRVTDGSTRSSYKSMTSIPGSSRLSRGGHANPWAIGSFQSSVSDCNLLKRTYQASKLCDTSSNDSLVSCTSQLAISSPKAAKKRLEPFTKTKIPVRRTIPASISISSQSHQSLISSSGSSRVGHAYQHLKMFRLYSKMNNLLDELALQVQDNKRNGCPNVLFDIFLDEAKEFVTKALREVDVKEPILNSSVTVGHRDSYSY